MHAAKTIRNSDIDVTLIDQRNFHLFQPLLYQVATGGLSPANIAAPLRVIFRRQKNVKIVLGKVVSVDPNEKSVEVQNAEPGETAPQVSTFSYDWLVVAAGSRPSYFGNADWEALAPGLKTIEDATEIRGRVLSAFEAAEEETDPKRRSELLTFVIVGGGPTGVELAGAIAELARKTLRDDFRNINPADANVIVVDGQDRMLGSFAPNLSKSAETSMARLGIDMRHQSKVTAIRDHAVELETGGIQSTIRSRTILWAAGVGAAPIGKTLAAVTGIETDRAGRVPVQPDLSIAGHPEIFVIGDLAVLLDVNGKPLPGVAPVAIQQGKHIGKAILAELDGQLGPSDFVYHDKGSLATIGRSAAVADLGKLKFTGLFAWLIWLLVHIMSIAQFQNRVLVFLQWSWNYFTFNRSARLITESSQLKLNQASAAPVAREGSVDKPEHNSN